MTVQDQLPLLMLDALEQVTLQAREQPIEKTKAIAAVLAYLYSLKPCERWPFDDFWRWLDHGDRMTRTANLNRCLNGICVQAGIDRTMQRPD